MASTLLKESAKALFSKLQEYEPKQTPKIALRDSKRGLALLGSLSTSRLRDLDSTLHPDFGTDVDENEGKRDYMQDVPMAQVSWRRQKRILAHKLTFAADIGGSTIALNSQLGESTILYSKATTLGSKLLYLLAACHKVPETVDIDDLYRLFEEHADSVSPLYFSILEYVGLCLDTQCYQTQSLGRNVLAGGDSSVFAPNLPLLYVTRKYEKVLLDYMPMNTPLFDEIDAMLEACEGRVTYRRDYWRAYPVISYVSQLVMHTLLSTAIRDSGAENVDADNLYSSGTMTDNCEPLYPMLYILFRMGQYESLRFVVQRYSSGMPEVVVSVCSAFWRLYSGFHSGNVQECSESRAALNALVSSSAYTSCLTGNTSTRIDAFLMEFMEFFSPFAQEKLLDSLQHCMSEATRTFDCIFSFSSLFHLTLSLFLHPPDCVENYCITVRDVNFPLTHGNIAPVRSLVAWHNVLTNNFYNAVYVLAEEIDLLPEAVALYFLLAVICKSYSLNSPVDPDGRPAFVLSEDSLQTFATIRDIYSMPFCPIDKKRLEAFANPLQLDTTTGMGIASVILAFLLCHCPQAVQTEITSLSRILPLDAQLVFLSITMLFLPFNESIISYKYFISEIYPLLQANIYPDAIANTVLSTHFVRSPSKLHRLFIFLLAGAHEVKEEVRVAFNYYRDAMTQGNGLELAFECATELLSAKDASNSTDKIAMLEAASKLRILYQTNENMRHVTLQEMFKERLMDDGVLANGLSMAPSSLYYRYRHVWVMLALLEAKLLLENCTGSVTDLPDIAEAVRLCNDVSGIRAMATSSEPLNQKLQDKGTAIASFLLDTYSRCRMAGYTSISAELQSLRAFCHKANVDYSLITLAEQMCNAYTET